MFVQVIEGRTNDADAVRKQFDRWREELQPGAAGFLGSTGGVTDDGRLIVMARFEDADAAKRNSDRPEQGAWWEETSQYLQDVTFTDSSEVDLIRGGGSNDAGFVQVMRGRATDKGKLQAFNERFEAEIGERRPDILGSIGAWDGDQFTEFIYFRSEKEAREGEAAMGDSEDMQELQALTADVRFLDLRSPFFL